MTNAEKITNELKKRPRTAKALAKTLRISRIHCFRVLHQIAQKDGEVREGKTGPMSALWKLP